MKLYDKTMEYLIANKDKVYSVTFQEVMDNLKISEPKLDNIFAYLKEKGYIKTSRTLDGRLDGYTLGLLDKGICYFELKKEHRKEWLAKSIFPNLIGLFSLSLTMLLNASKIKLYILKFITIIF